MADKKSIRDLLEDEIKDLYSAEKQLTKAIPKMAKGSNDSDLKMAFRDHLKETEDQVARLEQVAKLLEMKLAGKKCVGMEGCIKEGAEALEERGDEARSRSRPHWGREPCRALRDGRLYDGDQLGAKVEGNRSRLSPQAVSGGRARRRAKAAEDRVLSAQVGPV